MDVVWIWLSVGLVLCVLEFMTGTFYFLAVGIAVMETSLMSVAGAPIEVQVSACAGLIMMNIWAANRIKSVLLKPSGAPGNNLDAGERVNVTEWNSDGSARVQYRGAEWQADLFTSDMPKETVGYVRAINGNRLIISTIKEQQHA